MSLQEKFERLYEQKKEDKKSFVRVSGVVLTQREISAMNKNKSVEIIYK